MRLTVLLASLAVLVAEPAFAQAEGGQPFRVFFDWAKPELTRDAQAILDEAATAYQQSKPDRVMIAGHTDRSGSATHNLAASRRRVQAVKAYLATKGIPASAIVVFAYGESRPIVVTEDGVREAQNRRVEVSFAAGAAALELRAPLFGADGAQRGTVTIGDGPGGLTLGIDAAGLSPGLHGVHLHAVGRCDGPDFASAGPHWNPASRQHGLENPEGHHSGDLPNQEVGPNGKLKALINPIPRDLLDADGVALVIHAAPDDYRTDPSGNSGARIACAAFTR